MAPTPDTAPAEENAPIPADIVAGLKEGGLLARDASGETTAFSARDAIDATHRSYPGFPSQGRAYLTRLSSPEQGTVVNPGDPASALVPDYTDSLMWIVIFDVRAPKYGSVGGPPGSGNVMVDGTAAVFVNPRTGRAESAMSF